MWPTLLRQHSRSTPASKSLVLLRQFCIFFPCTLITVWCFWMFLFTPVFYSPWLPQGFSMECWGVTDQRTLNCFTLFRLILLTLFVARNLTLISLPLSRFLDSLLCVLIVLTPGLAFFLLMPRTLAVVSSFPSGRAYPFLNFLPPLFLRLTPTLIM